MRSIFDPCLLVNVSPFAATKQTDPRCEQPAGDESAHHNKKRFPGDFCKQAIGNCSTHNRIHRCEKEKVKRANQQEPADPAEIASNELAMRTNCLPQSFVVQRERNLDRTKGDDE